MAFPTVWVCFVGKQDKIFEMTVDSPEKTSCITIRFKLGWALQWSEDPFSLVRVNFLRSVLIYQCFQSYFTDVTNEPETQGHYPRSVP
jgi:hypothetical protein